MKQGLYIGLTVSLRADQIEGLEEKLPVYKMVPKSIFEKKIKEYDYTFREPLKKEKLMEIVEVLYNLASPRWEFRAQKQRDSETGIVTNIFP